MFFLFCFFMLDFLGIFQNFLVYRDDLALDLWQGGEMVLYGRFIDVRPHQESLREVAFIKLTIILHHKDFVVIFIFVCVILSLGWGFCLWSQSYKSSFEGFLLILPTLVFMGDLFTCILPPVSSLYICMMFFTYIEKGFWTIGSLRSMQYSIMFLSVNCLN